jgi:hypothetical protein
MMQQAIQDRRCCRCIHEDLSPLTKTLVGGQQGGIAFVPSVDQLEEEIGPVLAERDLLLASQDSKPIFALL